MRPLLFASLVAVIGALVLVSGDTPASAESVRVEAVVWQLDRDYPGAEPDDLNLPFRTVYIKTHDGTDWMSTYDPNPRAVAGPESLQELIHIYALQGIDVAAWFVPNGWDAETQLQMAKQVLDTGVKGLYADVEAFSGFCYEACDFLADNFWQRLRQDRPDAELGVIYDPRPQWWAAAAASKWLAAADVALPMCFWESYSGQQPWGDPGGCVLQAHEDLPVLAPGRALEYAPMLQGDTVPDRFKLAADTALAVGAGRVSIWRRGVVPAEVWDSIKGYAGAPPPCWAVRADNCLVKEASSGAIYLLEGGARFFFPDTTTLQRMGYQESDALSAPDGFLDLVGLMPRDGSLLSEEDRPEVYVVYGGARFWVPSGEAFEAMGFDWGAVRRVPVGGFAQIPFIPAPYTRFREMSDSDEWVIVAGARVQLDAQMIEQLLAAGKGVELYVVPNGTLEQIPVAGPPAPGDVNCDGNVDTQDALHLLRNAAGLPNLGLCMAAVGDVDCSAALDPADALAVLRYVAGLESAVPQGCPGPVAG